MGPVRRPIGCMLPNVEVGDDLIAPIPNFTDAHPFHFHFCEAALNDLIPQSPRYAAGDPPPDDAAFFANDEPLQVFLDWFKEAKAREPNDPNAMALATVDAAGLPNVRMVLLKDVDARGFAFYSNAES